MTTQSELVGEMINRMKTRQLCFVCSDVAYFPEEIWKHLLNFLSFTTCLRFSETSKSNYYFFWKNLRGVSIENVVGLSSIRPIYNILRSVCSPNQITRLSFSSTGGTLQGGELNASVGVFQFLAHLPSLTTLDTDSIIFPSPPENIIKAMLNLTTISVTVIHNPSWLNQLRSLKVVSISLHTNLNHLCFVDLLHLTSLGLKFEGHCFSHCTNPSGCGACSSRGTVFPKTNRPENVSLLFRTLAALPNLAHFQIHLPRPTRADDPLALDFSPFKRLNRLTVTGATPRGQISGFESIRLIHIREGRKSYFYEGQNK